MQGEACFLQALPQAEIRPSRPLRNKGIQDPWLLLDLRYFFLILALYLAVRFYSRLGDSWTNRRKCLNTVVHNRNEWSKWSKIAGSSYGYVEVPTSIALYRSFVMFFFLYVMHWIFFRYCLTRYLFWSCCMLGCVHFASVFFLRLPWCKEKPRCWTLLGGQIHPWRSLQTLQWSQERHIVRTVCPVLPLTTHTVLIYHCWKLVL